MKHGSTLFLKGVITIIGLAVLALCIFGLPVFSRNITAFISMPYLRYPVLLGFYATAIPFFIALFQGLKLLSSIDQNTAFSAASVKSLRVIKYCATSMTAIYLLAMPVVFLVAETDDAPGLILFWFAFACAPIVIATFAALLQKLLQNAIDLKSENELTV